MGRCPVPERPPCSTAPAGHTATQCEHRLHQSGWRGTGASFPNWMHPLTQSLAHRPQRVHFPASILMENRDTNKISLRELEVLGLRFEVGGLRREALTNNFQPI